MQYAITVLVALGIMALLIVYWIREYRKADAKRRPKLMMTFLILGLVSIGIYIGIISLTMGFYDPSPITITVTPVVS